MRVLRLAYSSSFLLWSRIFAKLGEPVIVHRRRQEHVKDDSPAAPFFKAEEPHSLAQTGLTVGPKSLSRALLALYQYPKLHTLPPYVTKHLGACHGNSGLQPEEN
jgi:hypothetical protein